MIVLVKNIEELTTKTGKPYLKLTAINVKDQSLVTKNIFDNIQDKWVMIQKDKPIELHMKDTPKDGKHNWNVEDISIPTIGEPSKPPPETPSVARVGGEPQAKSTPPSTPAPSVPIPGQQIGMTVKEIGDMIRAIKMKEIFGVEAAAELVKWYRNQILGTTKIDCDGSKLPQFNPQKKEAP